MTTLDCSKEKLSNSGNLDWNIIEKCAEKHLFNCAKYIQRVILEFNGVSKAYNRLLSERALNEQKYNELSQKSKNLDNCQNCTILEHRLQMQNSKFKAIADIFDQISVADSDKYDAKSKLSLEEAHDLFSNIDNEVDSFTNIESKQNVQTLKNELRVKSRKELFHMSTPHKRVCLQNAAKSEDSGGEIEETFLHQTSPILKKSTKRIVLGDNESSKKLPLKNVTNSSEDLCYLMKGDKILLHDNRSSSGNLETTISDSSIYIVPKNRENRFSSTNQTHISFSPQQNKKTKEKKLKQARLLLTKVKPKSSLDVSQTNCFQGGVRNIGTFIKQEDILVDDETTLFEENSNNQDNVDVISESPSCFKKVKNNAETAAKENKLRSPPKIDEEATSEDNRTMCCIPKYSPAKSKTTPKKQKNSPSPNKLDVRYGDKETIYKEEPVRKKAEKKKLQGWSCTKCGDFYKAAFRGNEEMINKHINECSKHRGRFNPERRNTPPGFWDMNMPPTQDTEAFNRQNNRL